MVKSAVGFGIALLLALPCAAPAAPGAVAQSVSRERLARTDAVLQKYVDDNRIGGAVVLVLKDGKPIYEKAVGWRDKEAGRPMTVDTVFRIASQTKAVEGARNLDRRGVPSSEIDCGFQW